VLYSCQVDPAGRQLRMFTLTLTGVHTDRPPTWFSCEYRRATSRLYFGSVGVMSASVEGLDVEDCGLVVTSGRVSDCAFADASTLVRSCFSHSVGAVKQLVSRRHTDIDAAVSRHPVAVCLSVCLSVNVSNSRCRPCCCAAVAGSSVFQRRPGRGARHSLQEGRRQLSGSVRRPGV